MGHNPFLPGGSTWKGNAGQQRHSTSNSSTVRDMYSLPFPFGPGYQQNHPQYPQPNQFNDARPLFSNTTSPGSQSISSQHHYSQSEPLQHSTPHYSNDTIDPLLLQNLGQSTAQPGLMSLPPGYTGHDDPGDSQNRWQEDDTGASASGVYAANNARAQSGVMNSSTCVTEHNQMNMHLNAPGMGYGSAEPRFDQRGDGGSIGTMDMSFPMGADFNRQGLPQHSPTAMSINPPMFGQRHPSYGAQEWRPGHSLQTGHARLATGSPCLAGTESTERKPRTKVASHFSSTQVPSRQCKEGGCKRNFRSADPAARYCTRHQDKWERNNAADAEYSVDPSISFDIAYNDIYSTSRGISPPDDDVGVESEDTWMHRLLAAVSKPYKGGGENEDFRKRQQTVYNGKRYLSHDVNVRMRFLYRAALTFHCGGAAVYPKGGDNDGYGNPDESLIFSERMYKINSILERDKRVCMDVIEGRGVAALVANPMKYEKRKTQNKQSNETKQKKQKAGEEVELKLKRKREAKARRLGLDDSELCTDDDADDDDEEEEGDDQNYQAGPAMGTRGKKRKHTAESNTTLSRKSKRSTAQGSRVAEDQQEAATALMSNPRPSSNEHVPTTDHSEHWSDQPETSMLIDDPNTMPTGHRQLHKQEEPEIEPSSFDETVNTGSQNLTNHDAVTQKNADPFVLEDSFFWWLDDEKGNGLDTQSGS